MISLVREQMKIQCSQAAECTVDLCPHKVPHEEDYAGDPIRCTVYIRCFNVMKDVACLPVEDDDVESTV
jgi:hypothetical protein